MKTHNSIDESSLTRCSLREAGILPAKYSMPAPVAYDLKLSYPVTARWIWKQSSGAVLAAIILITALLLLHENGIFYALLGEIIPVEFIQTKKLLLALAVAVLAALKFGINYLRRELLQYRLINNRLQVVRGIIFREEALLPLLPLTELYIKRSPADFIFGTADLYVALPAERVRRIAEIQGLDYQAAVQLKARLLLFIDERTFAADKPKSEELDLEGFFSAQLQ